MHSDSDLEYTVVFLIRDEDETLFKVSYQAVQHSWCLTLKTQVQNKTVQRGTDDLNECTRQNINKKLQ